MPQNNYDNMLNQVFSIIGYAETEFKDLRMLFYVGMLNEATEYADNEDLVNALEKTVKESDVSEILKTFQKYHLEERLNDAYTSYLIKYIDHVTPALNDKNKELIEKIKLTLQKDAGK